VSRSTMHSSQDEIFKQKKIEFVLANFSSNIGD
jgi:hypothetical protein